MLRLLLGLVVQSLLFAALILGPAWLLTGSLDWPRGWIAFGVLLAVSALGALWFGKTDPALARERASVPKPQTTGDAMASGAIALSALLWFAVAAIDLHRLHLGGLSPDASLWTGLAIFLGGVGMIVWTFRTNSFAITVVKIQDEREQRVIDTGPYAFVRHPMYMGAVAFFAGLGLLMGSTAAALLAVPLFILAFLPRMIVEEAVLRAELRGYADYQRRVRARIVPWVF